MGRLCGAWSFLEAQTETTLWGILDADGRLGPVISWRLDLRSRWQLILEHAPKKHNETDMAVLRAINKDVGTIARDRNIVIHGLVHMLSRVKRGETKEETVIPPCWVVFRGADAGKNFPVSTDAVHTIRANVQKVSVRVQAFNKRFS